MTSPSFRDPSANPSPVSTPLPGPDEVYADLAGLHQVALEEVLSAREKRAARQRQLLDAYAGQSQVALICFTMNISGPVKAFPLAEAGFESGLQYLEETLEQESYPVLHSERHAEKTGYTAYYAVQADPLSLKTLTVSIEDRAPLGRLFDLDVLVLDDESGSGNPGHCTKIGREQVGRTGRTCLICGAKAAICARSRRHTVEALQRRTIEILLSGVEPSIL